VNLRNPGRLSLGKQYILLHLCCFYQNANTVVDHPVRERTHDHAIAGSRHFMGINHRLQTNVLRSPVCRAQTSVRPSFYLYRRQRSIIGGMQTGLADLLSLRFELRASTSQLVVRHIGGEQDSIGDHAVGSFFVDRVLCHSFTQATWLSSGVGELFRPHSLHQMRPVAIDSMIP